MNQFILDIWKAIKMWAAFALAVAVIIAMHSEWQDWRERVSLKKIADDRESVNVDASTAAAFMVGSNEQCKLIGIVGLDRCSASDGQLPEEKFAIMLAKTSVGMRVSYYAKCEKFYPINYCDNLLSRAVTIAVNCPTRNIDEN
jgi:hypothetical protein